MTGKILVLGANGNIGHPLVRTLMELGEEVKAASRSGNGIDGAEGVVFDITNPATFSRALEGIDRAFVMLPTGYLEAKLLLGPLIEALAARKVKVVFLSVFGVEADDSIPYRQVELAVEQSGTPFVILRPNWFADNFLTFWKAGVDHGQIAVPAADGKTSFIDVRDVAQSAAAVLTTDHFDGHAFNLTGPEALSYAQAASLLSDLLGKPVTYNALDDAAFVTILTGAGMPQDYAHFLASIFYPVRQGWTASVTDAVEKLTGNKPRSLKTCLQDNLSSLTA